MRMGRIYYELRGGAKQRVLDKWRKWIEEIIELSRKDPKEFGYDPKLIEQFLKERCEDALEESECYSIIYLEILGKPPSKRDYYEELCRYADALLHDVEHQFSISREELIKKAFSEDPRDVEIQELGEEYVKALAECRYYTSFELYSIQALAGMGKLVVYNTGRGENIYNHIQFLSYLGFTQKPLLEMKYRRDNVFYVMPKARKCFYSAESNIIVLCDDDAMITNNSEKIFTPLGSYK